MTLQELNLITDRTAADVLRVKELERKGLANMTLSEKTEYLDGLKGAYNFTDLNRVNAAYEIIGAMLTDIGEITHYTVKKDWTLYDIPAKAQLTAYIDIIKDIRSRLKTVQPLPEAPDDVDNFTFEEANAIEKILLIVEETINLIKQYIIYSGEVYAGEVDA